jgi:hypothetical protein
MRTLDDPALGTCAMLFLILLFLTPVDYDRLESGGMNKPSYFLVVIT